MSKGPLFNNKKQNFSSRYSLGIESISNTMSDTLCPIIANVTSRPFYWILRCWCYYDLLTNSKAKNKITNRDIDNHYKRVNFFLCLGSILAGVRETGGFVGSVEISRYVDNNQNRKTFDYQSGYIKTMTQLNYYRNALEVLSLIGEKEDEDGKTRLYLYNSGKLLSESFDKVLQKTKYYEYRNKEKGIPREVLVELGKKITIDLKNFPESRQIFSTILFDKSKTLSGRTNINKEYVKYIDSNSSYDISRDLGTNRYVLFNHYSKKAENNELPENLIDVSIGWEIIVGRQYYSYALGIIWKYLLGVLNYPMNINEWINYALNNSNFSFSLDKKLSTIKDKYEFSFDEYEEMCDYERTNSNKDSIENGLKLILAMYNRFKDRDDLPNDENHIYDRDIVSSSSIYNLQTEIEKYADKPIYEYLTYIFKNQLIYQHLETAFNKLPDHDGYFIIENDGYFIKTHDYDLQFSGLRTRTIYSVIKDLGLL